MRDITFGAYYAANSKVHRLDPRVKMLITILYMVMLFFIDTFFMYGVILVLLMVIALSAKLPLLKVLRSIRGIIIMLTISMAIIILSSRGMQGEQPLGEWWIFSIYQSALLNGGRMGARLLLLMLGPTILTLTTTPMELTDAMDSFLKPLSLIKIPVYVLTLIMSIGLRFVPTLFDETDKIVKAQKARCADFDSANLFRRAKAMVSILIPLFISAMRHAGDLADAMDSRCFKGAGRTRFKKLKIRFGDILALFVAAMFFFGVLVFRYNWWNFDWLTDFINVIY